MYLSCWIRRKSDSIWHSRAFSSRCTRGGHRAHVRASPSSPKSRGSSLRPRLWHASCSYCCSRGRLADHVRPPVGASPPDLCLWTPLPVHVAWCYYSAAVTQCEDSAVLYTFVESMCVLVYCLIEEIKRPNWQTDLLINSCRYQGLECVFYTW